VGTRGDGDMQFGMPPPLRRGRQRAGTADCREFGGKLRLILSEGRLNRCRQRSQSAGRSSSQSRSPFSTRLKDFSECFCTGVDPSRHNPYNRNNRALSGRFLDAMSTAVTSRRIFGRPLTRPAQ
jgi:hypothetical protein